VRRSGLARGLLAWRTRSPSTRAKADEALLPRVRASFLASAASMAPGVSGMNVGGWDLVRSTSNRAADATLGVASPPQTTTATAGYWRAVNERRGAKRAQPDVRRRVGEPQMGRGLHIRLDRRRLALGERTIPKLIGRPLPHRQSFPLPS
jgi:hypothetical protein